MIFGCQSSVIYASVDIHIAIQAGVSMPGHSAIGIRKHKYPRVDIHFYGYQSSIFMLLWTPI